MRQKSICVERFHLPWSILYALENILFALFRIENYFWKSIQRLRHFWVIFSFERMLALNSLLEIERCEVAFPYAFRCFLRSLVVVQSTLEFMRVYIVEGLCLQHHAAWLMIFAKFVRRDIFALSFSEKFAVQLLSMLIRLKVPVGEGQISLRSTFEIARTHRRHRINSFILYRRTCFSIVFSLIIFGVQHKLTYFVSWYFLLGIICSSANRFPSSDVTTTAISWRFAVSWRSKWRHGVSWLHFEILFVTEQVEILLLHLNLIIF